MVKNPPANAGDLRDAGLIPGGDHGNPLQYCLENSHGHRSLVGYSPWGHKESDMTEAIYHAQQNAGDVLEELRDVQEDAELPRSQEDTVSLRMGWPTLYWVQLSNQFPSTHANPCDETMFRERSHAQEFLSGPKLEEVLGVSTKQEQLRMPRGRQRKYFPHPGRTWQSRGLSWASPRALQ